MNVYTAYRPDSGEIATLIRTPSKKTAEANMEPGEALYEGYADSHIHWIDDGVRKDRAEMVVVATVSEGKAELTGLPDGCEVRCLGEVETASGSITITFDEPGTYEIELRARPRYLDHALKVPVP